MNEEFYNNDYFSSFPDPLLSKKLLRFAEHPITTAITEDLLNSEISKLIYKYEPLLVYNEGESYYKEQKPIYYEGKPHSSTELEKFKTSNDFATFLNELDLCVTYINDWIREQDITIELDQRQARENAGMQLISATEEFDSFLYRLKNSYFLEFESYLFGDGKKYLEKLGLLLRNEGISLSFRKNQVISLVSDEGLQRCAGGCITILNLAVYNLQNYGVYTPHHLINLFIADISQIAAISNTRYGTNVILRISNILNLQEGIYDIHIYNYLLQRLIADLKINFSHQVNDPLISVITGPYHENSEIKNEVDFLYKNFFLKKIKKRLRTGDIVFFIANKIKDNIESHVVSPLEKLSLVENWLSELGEDQNFKREDFFSENEEFKLKLDFALERSIVDRLFQSGWLELDMSPSSRILSGNHPFYRQNHIYLSYDYDRKFPFDHFKPSYNVFFGNLELSWIEIDGKKQRILDYIKQDGGLRNLKTHFQVPPYIWVNSLIQTVIELDLFFKNIATKDIKQGLLLLDNNLSDYFATTEYDRSIAWMKEFSNEIERFSKIVKSVKLENQKKLLIYLVELNQPFPIKLQTILNKILTVPNLLRKELDNYIYKQHKKINEIFFKLFELNIKNFSGIRFYNFNCNDCSVNFDSHIYDYLLHLNFEYANFDNTIFDTNVRQCNFERSSMKNTVFKKNILETNFEQTDLRTVRFLGTHTFTLQLDGAKFSTQSFLDLLKTIRSPAAFFKGADLREVNFQLKPIKDRLVSQETTIDFKNALLQGVDLTGYFQKSANLVLLNNANLDGATLKECRIASVHTLHTSMRNVITGKTILRLDQLFQLYGQGHRDFSSDLITNSDLKIGSYISETLTGADLSLNIFLALHRNNFKNFDQKQLELLPIISHRDTQIITRRSLLERGQRVYLERLEQGQRKFQDLFEILDKNFDHYQKFKINVLNQAELMHYYLFSQNKLNIKGQCFKLTSAFSEAILLGKQEVYKDNLYVISQLEKRLIQGKPLSKTEERDRIQFLKSLDQFEQKDAQPAHLTSWSFSREIVLPNIHEFITLFENQRSNLAWHVNLIDFNSNSGHIIGVYFVNHEYTYFDSNVGYINGITDKKKFGQLLTQVLKKSYILHSNMRIYIDQYYPKYGTKIVPNTQKTLFSKIETEKNRLIKQDNELGYLIINGQLIKRLQLYNVGFCYHSDGNLNLPGVLIESGWELKQNFLDEGLLGKKFSINNFNIIEYLLNYVHKEKESLIRKVKNNMNLRYELKTIRALSVIPNYQIIDSPISTDFIQPLLNDADTLFERKTNLRNIEKLLKNKLGRRSQYFITELKKNHFQKELMHRLKGIKEKIPIPKALGGLIISKSFLDIGIALSQNNREAALIQGLMLSYGVFLEPMVEKSIINFPKKISRFVNRHSTTLKISDKVLDAKKIVIPTRIFAGVTSNFLDVVSLWYSINKFMESEYGSKNWRDAIADISIDSVSLLTGTLVVVYKLSFVYGVGAGVILISVKGVYEGASLLAEYKYYNLTTKEKIKNFFRASIGLSVSERVQYLRGRQDQMDNLVKVYWETLGLMREQFSIPIIGYGGGLGEYVTNENKQEYIKNLDSVNKKIEKINNNIGSEGKIPFFTVDYQSLNLGVGYILPHLKLLFSENNLSRITPQAPHRNVKFLCLPAFRNEKIEIENNKALSKNIPEVEFKCINAVVMQDKSFNSTSLDKIDKTFVLDMKYIYDGIIQEIPNFNNLFLIYNGTANFFGKVNNTIKTLASFYVKTPHYSGNISVELSTNSILMLQDESDIRKYKITFLPNQDIMMEVTSEKLNGDIQGKFQSKNIQLVVGRSLKQDIYTCHFPLNSTYTHLSELSGLGGERAKPDIYNNCLNVILSASSYYRLQANFNTYNMLGWSSASIKIDTDKAGSIVIEPITENSSALGIQSINFINLNIFRDAKVRYCTESNYLEIIKDFSFLSTDFNLEILLIKLKNYWNFEEDRSNYLVYDQYSNRVVPVLSKDVIYNIQNIHRSAECFYLEQFLIYRQLHVNTGKKSINLTEIHDYQAMIELEDFLDDIFFNSTILGPFKLNPNIKLIILNEIYPFNYTLTIGNDDKNFFNLIDKEMNVTSYYGSKNEDFYIVNLNEIKDKRLIKINNYDSDISIDRIEIVANHSCYELCIDNKKFINNKNFNFYILNREKELKNSCSNLKSICSAEVKKSYSYVAYISIQNYFLSSAYQHIEICVSIENEGRTCFIPFLDEDTYTESYWVLARYLRSNQNEEDNFVIDSKLSEIIIEGELKFQAIRREYDFILKKENVDIVKYDPFFLWFPDYYINQNEWDLLHIYSTKNATQVNSKMKDLDNVFLRKSSEFAIDYTLLENDVEFYELSFDQPYNVIIHNHHLLSFSTNRTRRDVQSFSLSTEFSIGYLEITKNTSYSLNDIKVTKEKSNLVMSVEMRESLTNEKKIYFVFIMNWNKPEHRLAGLVYHELNIFDLDQWELTSRSLKEMQKHIYEKILEDKILTFLESDLQAMVIWNRLRIYLLLPLPIKNYDTHIILHFMQKTLNFNNINEFFDFLPENEESTFLINDLKSKILDDEKIIQTIKHLLIYHVIKASFFNQENSKKIIIDSFVMIPELLITTIYNQIRTKLLRHNLPEIQNYIQTLITNSTDKVKLKEWLENLSLETSLEAAKKEDETFARKKRLTSKKLSDSSSIIAKKVENIITQEVVTSSATRVKSWFNLLTEMFYNPFIHNINDGSYKETYLNSRINYLKEPTRENLDYLKRNMKHSIQHHHEIKNKLSANMAQSSIVVPKIEPHRLRRNFFFKEKLITNSASSIVDPISSTWSWLKAKTNAIVFGATTIESLLDKNSINNYQFGANAEDNFNNNYQFEANTEGNFNLIKLLAYWFGCKSFVERMNKAAETLSSKNNVFSPIDLTTQKVKIALESNASLWRGKKFKVIIKKTVDEVNTFESSIARNQKLKGKRNNTRFFSHQSSSNNSHKTIIEARPNLFCVQ